jgi:DNA-binding NarL/FixJ family response regulator
LAATLSLLGDDDLAEAERLRADRVLTELRNSVADVGTASPQRAPDAGVAAVVSPREREVLAYLARGLTNRQISDQLGISEHTVHRHVTNILRKLALSSRAAAAAYAVRIGLVEA